MPKKKRLTLERAERLAAQGKLKNPSQRLYQLRHAAQGLCHLCTNKAERGRLCIGCAEAQAERRNTTGRRAVCKRCGGEGHYQKTCRAEVSSET